MDAKQQVIGIVQALLDQAGQAQKEIRTQELKIQALTMELAHLRRIRFGKKNESLSAVQLSLFEESVLADIAAVDTAIEQIEPTAKTAPAKPSRSRADPQPLPEHLPRIEHAMNLESCQCEQWCGRNLPPSGIHIHPEGASQGLTGLQPLLPAMPNDETLYERCTCHF